MLESQKRDSYLEPIIKLLLLHVNNSDHPNHVHEIDDDRRSYQLKKLPFGEISALRMVDSAKPGRIRVVNHTN